MSTAQIILITGLPGNGKTLLTVAKVDEWFPDRPVFYHNIKGLTKSWQPIPDPEKWFDLPTGSVAVFDECQDTFPTRSGKVEVPQKCKAFEKLRHNGLSAVLVTQKPRQLDIHVRELVGMHIHIERIMGTERAVTFTWNKVCEDVDDKANRAAAVKGIFQYPKEVYSQYQSAELHTFKRKIPWPILAIPFAIAAVGLCGYWAYDTLIGKRRPVETPVIQHDTGLIKTSSPKAVELDYFEARTPKVPGLPHTSPIYAEVTKPSRAPIPSACIASRSKCKCYTQDATEMLMGEQLCRQIAATGFFVDWADKEAGSQQTGSSEPSRTADVSS